MLLSRSSQRLLVLLVGLMVLLAACGSETDEPADADDGRTGGEFSMFLCEPAQLIPAGAGEICGVQVLEALFTGLVEYDAETGAVIEGSGIAESIESDDAQNWTITLKEGWTFHNGEEVTASSFVDAWNWMADPDNQMGNAFFLAMAGFEGFGAVAGGEAETMSGVEAVDDRTISITLDAPFGPFVQMLGHTAFFPLPQSFYDDPLAYEDAPIGTGRYMIDGEWERGVQIRLVRYDDYPGEPGNADAVTMRIYSDSGTAYLDFETGELDIHPFVPPEHRTSAMENLDGRFREQPTSSYAYLGFPLYSEGWQDADLRRAISMAIDRQTIIDEILSGSEVPATAVLPPTLGSHRPNACQYCDFDPDRAKELYDQSSGVTEPLQLYFNTGAGHDEWMRAVANMLRRNLGIEEIELKGLEVRSYVEPLFGKAFDGPFRVGWSLAYPSPQYALQPVFETDSSSNDMGYSNTEFDERIAEANRILDESAIELYQQAEDVVLDDMPIVPLWYSVDGIAWSEQVDNVVPDRSMIRIGEVEVVDE